MSVSRPLRIAYLNGSLDVGGAERQMVALASGLPRERFAVDFVLLTHRGALAPAAEAAGARVRVIGWTRRGSRLQRLRWPLDLARSGAVLRAGHYDIVDAWGFQGYEIAALTRPLSRIPILIAGRRRLSDFKARLGRLERWTDGLARRSSDAIVALSESVRQDVARREGLDPEALRLIRLGVLVPPPMAAGERQTMRARWGAGPADLVVGAVANYRPRKGLELLIEVAGRLQADLPQLRLVLVGEGPLRPVLATMIAERGLEGRVVLHGHAPDARDLYGAFDIVAHGSESEGGPNAVLEASAAGRPVVATAAGGTPEVVLDGVSGLLVPVGDEDAFERALRQLAADPELRERLGAAGRERAATVFGMDRMVREFAALYEELAERKGVRR